MSAAGHGASAFLHTSESLQGCSLSNQEFEIAVKLRLGSKIYANLSETCVCGHAIDTGGTCSDADRGMNGTVAVPQLTK